MGNTSQFFGVWSKQNVLVRQAQVLLEKRGGGNGLPWQTRRTQVASGRPKIWPKVSRPATAGGGVRRQDLEGRVPGRAARDAFPPCVFRLKGTRTFFRNNNKTSARGRRIPTLIPATPATCRRLGHAGGEPRLPARGSGGEQTAPFGQLLQLPPRRLARPGAGPWAPPISRKGAATAEDARPDCAIAGRAWARRAAVAGPAAISQVALPVAAGRPERPVPFSNPRGGTIA